MTRLAYNSLRGWEVPSNEDPLDEGYLVEYIDGGQANVPGYQGYVSWSPKAVFEKAYRPTQNLTFGFAIEAMKAGMKVARDGWNGKGMWLTFVSEIEWEVARDVAPEKHRLQPFIGMKTAQEMFVPWLASQSDMLADDWRIVE